MSELTDRERDKVADTSVSSHEATQFVSQCDSIDESELKTFLSQHVAKTDTYLKLHGKENTEKYIRIVAKGLRKKSKQSNALRFFYYGYHIRQQEELLDQYKTEMVASARTVLVSKKHYGAILKFLYERGCSQQKIISETLGINKSNLNRMMNSLLENDLVVKSVGPRCVFFELSSSGYKFVREHSLLGKPTVSIKRTKSPLQSYVEEIKLDIKKTEPLSEFTQAYETMTRWLSAKRNVEFQNDLIVIEQQPQREKVNEESVGLIDITVDRKTVDSVLNSIRKKQGKDWNQSSISDARNLVRNGY